MQIGENVTKSSISKFLKPYRETISLQNKTSKKQEKAQNSKG